MANAEFVLKIDKSAVQDWLDKYIPDLTTCGLVDCSEKANDHNRIEAKICVTGLFDPYVRVYLCDKHFEALKHLHIPLQEGNNG